MLQAPMYRYRAIRLPQANPPSPPFGKGGTESSRQIVWREFAATAAIGGVCFVGALRRFRQALTAMQI